MKNEYRIAEGYGNYFNKRWEVQKKYFYYENGKKIEAWGMVFHSANKKDCEEVLKKYQNEKKKDYRIPELIF